MASPQQSWPRKGTNTASTCTASHATHTLEIAGYSMYKRLGANKFIRSATFDVGGYQWCIRVYPDGLLERDYVAVFLELLSNSAEVSAHCDLGLIDQTTKSSVSLSSWSGQWPMNTVDASKDRSTRGVPKFMKTSELEGSTYLRDDRLMIECVVTVFKEVATTARTTNLLVEEPSSPNGPNLTQDFANLLDSKEGADVTFKVEGDIFRAHAIVLAARSSVFKAQFYGPWREQRDQQYIAIEDIQPGVFRELLHFMYTDTMSSSMSDLDEDEKKQLIQHLLVAADRYDVQRLKAVCERVLCDSLHVESVAAMLALADQLNCRKLKDACIDFIVCPDMWDGVAACQGFSNLKRSCPSIMVDILDRAVKSRKI